MNQQELIQSRREEPWRTDLRKELSTKERTSIPRQEMPHLEGEERMQALYHEVNLGLTDEQAILEARRCLDCPKPGCMQGCPVSIHIPTFIKYIEKGELDKARDIITQTSSLSAICSRVCPHENQCEGGCIYTTGLKKRAVAIGPLERYVADWAERTGYRTTPIVATKTGHRIAVIGSGPAGLAFARDMALWGHEVTIYEAQPVYGGVMRYGIPEFRLPSHIIDREIDELRVLGVHFVPNTYIGKDISVEELEAQGFSGCFVAIGAVKAGYMGIPGEELAEVTDSTHFLRLANLHSEGSPKTDELLNLKGKRVAVVGGGNTAMDVLRVALRLGAEQAMLFYRRTEVEMPACREEIEHALEEGADFRMLHVPIAYHAGENGKLKRVEIQRMELGEPDERGRRAPKPIPGDIFELEIDYSIVSIGSSVDSSVTTAFPGLKTDKWGSPIINEEGQSSIEWLYAGGDAVRGGATVVEAMGDGRRAARAMHERLIRRQS